jgi:hypothetical protein
MTSLAELGLAETAGVDADIAVFSPPRVRFHQEGVVDMVFAGYIEPESDQLIPVGRVVTSPYTEKLSRGEDEDEWEAATSKVLGIAGIETIYRRFGSTMYLPNSYSPPVFYDADKIAKNLHLMQTTAAKLVLAHFGLQPPRSGLLRKRQVRLK